MDIKKKIKKFPGSPGIYLMKDKQGRILYVGKASSLRKRVGSYFQKPPAGKTRMLLSRTADIEYIRTASSAQALLLENSLIKRYKPYYNAALKDDKSYPYVKISEAQAYPCVSIVRGKREKGARYYGPYTNVKLLKSAVKAARAVFPFRSCERLPKKPCLYFHLKRCPGMCVKKVNKKNYRGNLKELGLFLEGRHARLIKQLQGKMQKLSKGQRYEDAAVLRNKISALSGIFTQAGVVSPEDLILELQKALGLDKAPYRIEAFDISQIGGKETVGSMVSFFGAWPDKKNYRKFRIKMVKGIDDYAMIREVLLRRYSRRGEKGMPPLPNLVMIDGGKGHLSCARAELKRIGMEKLPVIALAKRLETVYTPEGKALRLRKDSKVLHLLQRIRDEAHRFAISYHRRLRQKGMRASSLDDIPGIGWKRKQALLRHFKSVEAIRKASLADLLKVKGMDRRTAERIVNIFSPGRRIGADVSTDTG
jgi:excinuclease ABC subunit C